MSKKEELINEAVKVFGIHTQIEKLYLTADKQAFTEKQNAEDHARYLEDENVYEFDRDVEPVIKEPKKDAEREKLFAEHEELFGSKPPHNIGTKKLQQKIEDEKQARKEADDKGTENETKKEE